MFESLICSFSAYLLLGSKEFSESSYFQGNDKFQGLPVIIRFPVSWGIKKKNKSFWINIIHWGNPNPIYTNYVLTDIYTEVGVDVFWKKFIILLTPKTILLFAGMFVL